MCWSLVDDKYTSMNICITKTHPSAYTCNVLENVPSNGEENDSQVSI